MEQKRRLSKFNVLNASLFVAAIVFAISLLLSFLDLGNGSAASGNPLCSFGNFLFGAYGYSSIFIPVFFLVAALQMIGSKWTLKRGVILAGSLLPFFTLVAVEHICKIFISNNTGGILFIKVSSTILFGALFFVGEYMLLLILGDVLQERYSKGKFDFDDLDEADFDKATEEDTVILNDDLNEADSSVILDDMLEKATEIENPAAPEGDTVLAFVRNQVKPVDLNEILFKSAEREVREARENNSATSNPVEENTNFDEEPKSFSEIIEAESDAERQAEIAYEEEPKSFSEIIEAESNTETANDVEDEDESNEDFWNTGIDATAFDGADNETENTESKPESKRNKFAHIFDAVENNSEVKLSTWKYEEKKRKILPDILPETPHQNEIEEESVNSIESTDNSKYNVEPVIENTPVIADNETTVEPQLDENIVDNSNDKIEPENDVVATNEPVTANFVRADDIFSIMDDDAAENPVLKDSTSKIEQTEKFETGTVETVSVDTTVETEKTESVENQLKEENEPQKFEFDPTARPVVDSNGNLIADYENESNSEPEMEDDLESEIMSYENALRDEVVLRDEVALRDKSEEAEYDEENSDSEMSYSENYDESESYDETEENEEEAFDIDSAWNNPMKAPSVEDDSDDIEEKKVIDSGNAPVIDVYASSTNKVAPKKEFRKGPYEIPFDLLEDYPGNDYWVIDEETRLSGAKLKSTLSEFKIDVEVTGIRKGPAVTMYELLPAPGVKLSKIESLQDNIALDLAARSVRIVAPIPGKHAVGIEVPNKKRAIVGFKELIEKPLEDFEKMSIPVVLGKDISGDPQLIDLAKTPHLLIAGSTGAGKSVCVNTMLLSILYKKSPSDVKLVLVDPKVVEMKLYNDIPHLLTPVITEPKRALQALQYCLCEMERRYALLANMNVREIRSYNKKIEDEHIATEKLPYIVVVIDEFADLMMTTGKELETVIARLAAKSRAIGIHLVLATQRPSTDVITGIIKANLPSRIAFMVASQMDSRVILDKSGAENLLGKGDMLYIGTSSPFTVSIQGTLVRHEEVEKTVEYVKSFGEPEYIDDEMFVDEDDEGGGDGVMSDDSADPLYDQALQIVIQQGKASASYIQRRLSTGYNRAARIVEEMEARGIVGPANGAKPREIIHMP